MDKEINNNTTVDTENVATCDTEKNIDNGNLKKSYMETYKEWVNDKNISADEAAELDSIKDNALDIE